MDIGLGVVKAVGTNLLGDVLVERSASLASEACDAACTVAAGLVETFEEDKRRSRRVTLELWHARPRREKAKDRLAALLRSQL